MADSLVVDASVITKWIVPEEDHELAELIYRGEFELIAPAHWHAEVANALWKKQRLRGDITLDEAHEGHRRLSRLRLMTRPLAAFEDAAFTLALDTGVTVYDALYIALAQQEKCRFVTADDRLVDMLGSEYAGVAVKLRDFTFGQAEPPESAPETS